MDVADSDGDEYNDDYDDGDNGVDNDNGSDDHNDNDDDFDGNDSRNNDHRRGRDDEGLSLKRWVACYSMMPKCGFQYFYIASWIS